MIPGTLKFQIVASGGGFWGKANTIQEAMRNCKRAGGKRPMKIVLIPAGAEVDAYSITYPVDAAFTSTELGVI